MLAIAGWLTSESLLLFSDWSTSGYVTLNSTSPGAIPHHNKYSLNSHKMSEGRYSSVATQPHLCFCLPWFSPPFFPIYFFIHQQKNQPVSSFPLITTYHLRLHILKNIIKENHHILLSQSFTHNLLINLP